MSTDTGTPSTPAGQHLSVAHRVQDILRHQAFAGYARKLLPWDDARNDEATPINDIGRLLPYHTQVRPDVVLGALNRMIDDVGQGRTIHYDIYTDSQKADQPARVNTGLFFFRGKPGAPFAIISPGGGFSYVGSVHEGFPYALELNRQGYNAFVLKYRVGQGESVAVQDLAAAIAFVFEHSRALEVDTTGYSLWGSSAGARMAARIGSHGATDSGRSAIPKPATVVMAYTGHSEVASSEPATFVVVGEQDGIAPPAVMERRVLALRRAGVSVAFKRYPNLGHGFGLGTGTSAEGWVADAIRFWQSARQ